MIIDVQGSAWTRAFVSHGCIPGDIAGSHNSIVNHLRNHQVFAKVKAPLHILTGDI
jgi:hypothetical protein